MSETVARLKELLFDSEAQALAELSRRLEQVSDTDARGRAELKVKLDEVMERAGSTERFTSSVAEVINDALRRAEVLKHDELSISIAPLVVTTIKAELKNSQDEMVEALYPITGRLVKAYVASAIKDLTEEMNRRLEQNPLMLRLQSLTTGRSVAELALAGTQDFELLELFLIRRGSGALVAHWPQAASGREQLMSGVLAAVNAFANEAFAADEGSLRQIDLGEETVYLRGSQLYLLAAKCSGTAPKGIEQILDDAFLETIEKERKAQEEGVEPSNAEQAKLLADLGTDVTERVTQEKRAFAKPAGNPLKVLALAILLPLLAWLSWSFYADFANARTRSTAARVIAATRAMQGYPAHLDVSDIGRNLRISGLAPSQAVKDKVLSRLTQVLPRIEIQDEFAVVPGSDISIPDTAPQLDDIRRSLKGLEGEMTLLLMRRSSERAARRLASGISDLKTALSSAEDPEQSKRLETSAANIGVAGKELSSLHATLTSLTELNANAASKTAAFDALAGRIAAESLGLSALLGGGETVPVQDSDAPSVSSIDPGVAAEALVAEAERFAALASALALSNRLAAPKPVAPDPRTVLEDYAKRHAVFFANGTDYRHAAETGQTLDALVPLLKTAGTLVRIVGYTDVAGAVATNSTLAQERADKVRADLIQRGAPANLLAAVGRRDSIDLSPSQGIDSPNRRVAFELGYDGENTR